MEDYVHRIGRTGRAGSTGRATSFYTDRDMVFPFAILTFSLCLLIYVDVPVLTCALLLCLISQYLVAQIRRAIADIGSGNDVTIAMGKVCLLGSISFLCSYPYPLLFLLTMYLKAFLSIIYFILRYFCYFHIIRLQEERREKLQLRKKKQGVNCLNSL